MATIAEPATFKHDALPDASTYIRLLEVASVNTTGDVSIQCRLTTWPKASAPAYTAISYTWGDPRRVMVIFVNDQMMTVRRNCGEVLRQQCWAKGGYFWIDAICINQADNDEKSFQVAMMGELYQDARQTLACVGHHADDSEFLFETLHEHRRGYMGLGGDLSDTENLSEHLSLMLSDESTLESLEQILGVFFGRSYFQRVWIYQELFFGNDIHLCCDDGVVELSLVWALWQTIRTWIRSRSEPNIKPGNMSVRQSHYFFENDEAAKFLLEVAVMGKSPVIFSPIIPVLRSLQCDDPRDRVFGTLAIIDWEGKTPIRPDYSKDPFDLAVEVLRSMKDTCRDYLAWILQDAVTVANLVELPSTPSRRLVDEIRARQSRENMASREARQGTKGRDHTTVGEPTIFWGYRMHSDNAGWCMLFHPSKDIVDERPALRHKKSASSTSRGQSLTIQEWSRGTAWDVHETAILLPEEAEPQDWLLIPDLVFAGYTHTPAALIARDGHDGHTHIVGKALFAASGDWPWKALQLEGSKFGVYIDHEDAIVLAQSCCWNAWGSFPRNADEPHKFQVDGYFATRLCGERSKTWAKRVNKELH